MSLNNTNIEIIIPKALAGTASRSEMDILAVWLSESGENQKSFLRMKNIWEVSNPALRPAEIDTLSANRKVIAQIGKTERERKRKSIISVWQRTAAIIALPFMALSIYLCADNSRLIGREIVMQEVFAPYGTRSSLTLSDGSNVWLNAGSSMKYPVRFSRKERAVEIEGEAYFEVAANEKSPFVVNAGGISVTALGTGFNVEAYPADSLIAVTLVEGIVRVKLADNAELSLQPREHLVYNTLRGSHSVYMGDTFKWCAWKDGIIAFRNDPLNYVFKRLGQTYNIDFIVSGDIRNYVYHATFEGESLDEILDLLERSAPIQCRKEQRKYENDLCQKQTIHVFKKNKSRKGRI